MSILNNKTNTVVLGLCQDVHMIHTATSLVNKGFEVIIFDSVKYSPGLKIRGIKDKFVNEKIEKDDLSLVNLLNEIGSKYPGSILLTGDDHTSYILCKYKKELKNFRFLTLDYDTYQKVNDKYLLANLAKSYNIKVPLTSKIDAFRSSDVLPYTILIKPKLGEAGEKQVKCNDISQYKSFIESNKDNLDDYFIQEYIDGPISNLYSINIVMDENFNPICTFSVNRLNIFRSKKILEGITTFLKGIPLENLIRDCKIFLKKIKYVGFGELEFKKDDNGRFNLIEINTRLWAYLKLATVSGIDFPYSYIKYLLKKDDIELDDINLNNFKEDLYYLRWAPDFYSNIFRIINKERSLADFIKIMYQRLILIIKGKLIIEKFESFRWIFLILRQRNRWV